MLDTDLFGAGLADIVREQVEKATAALAGRLAAVEARTTVDIEALVAEMTERGFAQVAKPISADEFDQIKAGWEQRLAIFDQAAQRVGEFGERLEALPTVDIEALTVQIAEQSKAAAESAVNLAIEALPKPEVSLTDEQMAGVSLIAEETARAVAEAVTTEKIAALPVPQDGKNADPDEIAAMVERAVAALPPPKDGDPGKDGLGLASAIIDRTGALILTMTDGSTKDLGNVVGRDGIDAKGEPGRDGLTLSGFDTELSEDGRILTLSLENDEIRVTHELQLPTMIYRGVFKDGQTYVQGDTVTWAGSLWHCDAETTDKPGEGASTWRLAVKKGRDAK